MPPVRLNVVKFTFELLPLESLAVSGDKLPVTTNSTSAVESGSL